jgi:precorrin-2 dehydrogenase/sirohydrochlorin ferrochelatase
MMNVRDMPVTVIGGGRVALRKVRSLLDCGASVTVISPETAPELESLVAEGRIRRIAADFEESMLDERPPPVLVFGTTDQREVNIGIHRAAVDRNIPCNIADVPDLCTFIVPAVTARGDLTVAISTGGSSPAFARRIREELDSSFGPEYAMMTRLLGDLRGRVLEAGTSSDDNRGIFFRLVDSPLLSALRTGDRDRAVEILRSVLPSEIEPEALVDEALKG